MGVLTETYRGVVTVHDCDHFGRMSPPAFYARLADAESFFTALIGLDRKAVARERVTLAAAHHEIDYRRTFRADDTVRVLTEIAGVDEQAVVLSHTICDGADGETAATATGRLIAVDCDSLKPARLPEPVLARCRALMAETGADGA